MCKEYRVGLGWVELGWVGLKVLKKLFNSSHFSECYQKLRGVLFQLNDKYDLYLKSVL